MESHQEMVIESNFKIKSCLNSLQIERVFHNDFNFVNNSFFTFFFNFSIKLLKFVYNVCLIQLSKYFFEFVNKTCFFNCVKLESKKP